ncbi:vitamin B12 dependent-methionine synthase activation domain-containing protein [Ruminococcus sp.]|uniref:vitamin B12 dependent-methionine synthase activation domain-containing protein n=1 Tax=Ruminococcus sp. TaxID=41978 RepID=UPI001B753249|nr:vitamin B12 dependent-methionine synthase activation domain-containing protein [Ruminococcus sp.]MBP5433149.1 5-methyltetrahydrofolate--homocysteine methyltransferase [Ruminococcus sp.]
MELQPISKTEAARYMGVRGEPDSAVLELLDRAEKQVREALRPKYVYIETDISMTEEGVLLGAMTEPLTGEDIRRHLKGCDKAVLLAATLSQEADKFIRQAAVTNMAYSLALDCICSAAIEQVCERAEEEIFSKLSAPYRTWRFSPGYGDLPLTLQRGFLLALNAQRRIGLTVTDSSLLIPSKSVTAVIGISDAPVTKGSHGCAVCTMKDSCAYRLSGINCKK